MIAENTWGKAPAVQIDFNSTGSPPGTFTLSGPVPGNTEVGLSWSAAADADSYTVKYGMAPGTYTTTIPSVSGTSYNVTGLTNGTLYYFRVTAVNGSGSRDSNEQTATPAGGGCGPGPAGVLCLSNLDCASCSCDFTPGNPNDPDGTCN